MSALNRIIRPVPMKSLILILSHYLRMDNIERVYDNYVADMLYIAARNDIHAGENAWWRDKYAELICANKADSRSAKDIFRNLESRGIRIKDAEERKRLLGDNE